MEKYRQFADGGTGVNPFVPAWSNYKQSLLTLVGRSTLLFPVALIRLALFLVAILWLMLSQLIALLIPVGLIRYPIYRLLTQIGSGIALLALGVLPTSESMADYRRLKLPPPKVSGASTFDAGHGVLVFANYQSIADVLFLTLKLSPVFVFVADDGAPVQVSLLSALLSASARGRVSKFGRSVSLTEMSNRAYASSRGPVVVFAEGARTNGSCVLAFKARTFEGSESLDKCRGVALASLEYSKTGPYTPQHTVGGRWQHIFRLSMQPWHALKSCWLSSQDAVPALKSKPLPEQASLLRTLLVRMLPSAVEVDVTADKYSEFIKYWDASRKKGYTQQQREQKRQ